MQKKKKKKTTNGQPLWKIEEYENAQYKWKEVFIQLSLYTTPSDLKWI